ncbi:MAG: DNA topoisomerase I [Ignavibacteria bacterium GWA2_54_16]|nr:MAG: DNA topoisomerase I [Ignavibacteria bacterium GWA2_54_16]
MEKSLIIVESPSKAKTINKYLGKEYIVEASVGHIKNLPKSKLGVDVENEFAVVYENIAGKDEVIQRLRERAGKAKAVFLATDPDREGEAIAAHLADEIKGVNKNIKRVLFHEITAEGVKEGMRHPKKVDTHMVLSQQARRAMDRIVGYKVTPFVWKTVYYGLSAGRVQSVALRLICERETAIGAFVAEEYWSITGEFQTDRSEPFLAKLFKVAASDPKIPDETTMRGYLEEIRKQQFEIGVVERKPVKRNPPAPFITSTLQQEAARRLRFSAKRTMMLAQKLYEGVDVGDEGPTGLITYMRTDSTRLSADAVAQVREYIFDNYGKEYLPKEPRLFKKGKASQDAHEAIRPTSIKLTPKDAKKHLDKDLYLLYELIWNRFIACQMSPAEFEQMSVDVAGGEYLFRATDQRPLFRGFLQVYDDVADENGGEKDDSDPVSKLPESLAKGQQASLKDLIPRQHFTKPPARYTESSLVKELESLGIGRPSTYAMIVSTVIDRKYVEQNERKLFATQLGMQVNKLLVQYFPDVFNVRFTARMEEELDTIASGKQLYVKVMKDFYDPFIRALEKVDKNAQKIKKSLQEETSEVCEICGRKMIIKWGRNGRFMACAGYPACKNSKPLAEDQEKHQHLAGMKCDLCGGDMVVKSGRFGTFLGCSNYPTCKNTKPISMGIPCPKCKQGDLVERKTKKGKRTFYGCNRYPECDFASWDKPVNQPCSNCGSTYLVAKYSQAKGEYLKCPECGEEFVREQMAVGA